MDDGIAVGSAPWRTGEVIDGRYGMLGPGGMGVVHRVWGTDLAVRSR